MRINDNWNDFDYEIFYRQFRKMIDDYRKEHNRMTVVGLHIRLNRKIYSIPITLLGSIPERADMVAAAVLTIDKINQDKEIVTVNNYYRGSKEKLIEKLRLRLQYMEY